LQVNQNYKGDFSRLLTKKDTAAQWQLLQNWQQADPTDAELFMAYFNYYFHASRQEMVRLSDSGSGNSSLAITDSTGEQVGFLTDDFDYDSALLEKAFQYIDKGISTYSTRLDMRCGKIYALGQIENYERFTNEIVTAIEVSNQLKSQWTWADNKKVEDPEKFFLGTIQDYVVQLYNAGDDQLDRMRTIAQTVLKYYPKHVESLSNLAITYGLQGDYDKALQSLLQAEKLMPRDVIVLNNIATMYERKGDKLNAIKYFELTAKLGDKEIKDEAVKKLKALKN
jgi:tetratricopeptide (TPR) repeat protein